MFGLVAVHYDTAFGLKLPCTLIYVENDDIHAEIHGCFLGAETCAKAGVEKIIIKVLFLPRC